MLIKNTFLAITLSSLMAGCSVTEQDVGLGSDAELGGRVVDGYIARAIVFVDSNENGVLEAWESRAYTDGDGYFTYNPLDQVNYCVADTPRSLAIHCLRFPIGIDESLIRVLGGYDITTGEPFKGMMTLRASPNTDVALLNNSSPITSLLAVMNHDNVNALAASMGYADTSPLLQDFLQRLEDIEDNDQESQRRVLTGAALQAHKMVDVLAHYLEGLLTSNKFGDSKGLPEDSTPFVYQAMATVISTQLATDSSFDLNTFFKTNTSIKTVIEKAAELIEKVAKNDDESVSISLPDNDGKLIVANRAVELAEFIQTLFSASEITNIGPPVTPFSDKQDIQARLRAIEVVTTLLRKQANITSDPTSVAVDEVRSAMELATGTNSSSYLVGLSSDKVDIQDLASTISTNVKNGLETEADVANFDERKSMQDQLALDQPITQIIDKTAPVTEAFSLNLTEKTATDAPSTAEEDKVDFKFNTDGTLTANIKFSDNQSSDFNIDTTKDKENGDPGEPLPGTWEPINDTTMLVNIEVAGVVQPVIVKTDSDGSGYKFDYGGKLIEWDGAGAETQ